MRKKKRLLALLLCLALVFTCVFPAGAEEAGEQNEELSIQPRGINDYYLLGWNFFLSDSSAERRKITNGYRRSDDFPDKFMHAAIDVAGAGISSVYARPVHEGTILRAWNDERGFGNYVVLETNQLDPANTQYGTQRKIRVGYAHLQDLSYVYEGKAVGVGNNIGKVGNSGESYGYHMHFMVFRVPTNAGKYAQSEISWVADRSTSINPERFYANGYFTEKTNYNRIY